LARAQAEVGGVTSRLSPPPAIALKADERRLRQCVVNLLANTIKFAPGGEVAPVGRDGRGQGHRDPDRRYRLRHSAGPARSGTLRLDSAIGRSTTAILPGRAVSLDGLWAAPSASA
jgi:hypothetical protein